MSKYKFFRKVAVAAVIAGPLTAAMATNGYFSHGYGMKAKGMGGASVAMTDNAFAGANNPAISAFAGDRTELGLDLFMPEREFSASATGSNEKSESNLFYVPEFGLNRAINDKIGVGLTVYGNGGMNSDYRTDATFGGSGNRLGIDLTQLIIAPSFAYKFSANHSVGVSPLLIQQQFKANYPNQTNGFDTSSGIGWRFGYLGKLSSQMNVGVSYAPRTIMSKFSKYSSFFLDQGGFDIPENYTVGVSVKASPSITVAADYQRINYADVKTIGTATSSNGFGWNSIDVLKVGAQWEMSPTMTLRAGVNIGGNPIGSEDVTMNILAPGVTTTHYTIGGTYAVSKNTEITFAYMNAPTVVVSGARPAGYGGGTDTIKMSQQSIGFQFGWKY